MVAITAFLTHMLPEAGTSLRTGTPVPVTAPLLGEVVLQVRLGSGPFLPPVWSGFEFVSLLKRSVFGSGLIDLGALKLEFLCVSSLD